MNAIVAGYDGKTDMFVTVGWFTKKAEPTVSAQPMTAALFDAKFG